MLLERGSDGRFPARPDFVLPLAEYVRQAAIRGALAQELDVIATNSDGNPQRRAFLLSKLGHNAVERIVDPGEAVVSARLADPLTGEVAEECEQAIARWFSRVAK